MLKKKSLSIFILLCASIVAVGQFGYWQQSVAYEMAIDFDVKKHQFSGIQQVTYTNNSPDTLDRVYFHLYFNAFQPGSSMDIRSQTIADPDPRIGDRISKLEENEIGFHRIKTLSCNGKKVNYQIEGTVLTVFLDNPILPRTKHSFHLEFDSQVPIQIRRSGRNNKEGIDYTMTQWYPKLAEYDQDGWHTDPYVCREFHGVFGSFDVSINIDPSYIIGGTGVLQETDLENKNGKKTWRFLANNVHDFAWAADPDFLHTKTTLSNGTELNFYYQNDTAILEKWKKLVPQTVKLFEIMNARFGEFPYEQFSVIQGGDGGMEYPMCTMISGTGSFGGLVSVTVHEAIHNWYYGVLATNELKYPWMDEGFTTFAQNLVLDSLRNARKANPHERSYQSYIKYVTNKDEEPLTTHADHYHENRGYGVASYSKGCVFLSQLEYIIGTDAFFRGMKRYFNAWKFKHPTPTDFKRIMEKTSGIELDWYFEGWVGTTNQIDYNIKSVTPNGSSTTIRLENQGGLSMPLEIDITINGETNRYYIPIERMRKGKDLQNTTALKPWPWAYPTYVFDVPHGIDEVHSIVIDPEVKLADVNRQSNRYPIEKRSTDFIVD